MALLRLIRNETVDRQDQPTGGRHRSTRKARRERVAAGGRHVRVVEPAQSSGSR